VFRLEPVASGKSENKEVGKLRRFEGFEQGLNKVAKSAKKQQQQQQQQQQPRSPLILGNNRQGNALKQQQQQQQQQQGLEIFSKSRLQEAERFINMGDGRLNLGKQF